ncbi:MAG TPA: hypothetical protein VFC28_08130, partial [Opitutaceae bacterium]|nr:hypothetical protein [Opitutaceae bacterium]
MSIPDQWQENNAQRLAAALAALRDRLARAAPRVVSPVPVGSTPAPAPVQTVAPPVPAPSSPTMSRSLFQKLLRSPAPADKPAPIPVPAAPLSP